MPNPEAPGSAMQQAIAAGAQAAIVRGGPFFSAMQRQIIIDSAAEFRLPVIYERRDAVQGGLLSYSADHIELYRAAARYVVRVLGGENAADLPVQQPTKFELVINLKTAKALGIDVPGPLLLRANEVIE